MDLLHKKYGSSTEEKEIESNLVMENQIQIIRNFYGRDDISVQAAGRKDTYIINGEVVSKCYMIMTISEAYELYKNEMNPDYVGKSLFYQFRPKHIQLSSKTPHNMCVCQYHSNFGFLLKSCGNIITSFPDNFESS